MSEPLQSPLVADYVDLRDFAYMPLDVVRVRDSDLAALSSGDGFRAAVMLWCASWHQAPAASLPTDDRVLAKLAGYGRDLDGWLAIRDEALRGFILCSDGRLYHPVISEKANEAWDLKAARRARTEAATAARQARGNRPAERDDDQRDERGRDLEAAQASRRDKRDVRRNDDRDDAGNVHQGKGTEGKEEKNETRAERAAFDRFWAAWPNKVSRPAAVRAFKRHAHEIDEILAGVKRYIRDKPADRQWKNPATFLNQESWHDRPAPPSGGLFSVEAIPGDPIVELPGGLRWPESRIKAQLAAYRDNPRSWIDMIGPPPGHPGCRIPKHLLEQARAA